MVVGSLVRLSESAMLSAGWEPSASPGGMYGIVIGSDIMQMDEKFPEIMIVMVSGKSEMFFREDLILIGESYGQEV